MMSTNIVKLATVPQIEKVHGVSNYHMWKSLTMTFLHIMGVASIVFGDVKHPTQKASSSTSDTDRTIVNDLPTWELASHHAKGFIIVNIDSSLLLLVTQYPDTLSIWKTLQECFDCKMNASLHTLIKSVLTL